MSELSGYMNPAPEQGGQDSFAAPSQEGHAAGPAPVVGQRRWEWPIDTVGRLINNLQNLPPEMRFYTAYFVELNGERIARTTHPSLSRETVANGRVQKYDDSNQALVIWATAQTTPVAGLPEFPDKWELIKKALPREFIDYADALRRAAEAQIAELQSALAAANADIADLTHDNARHVQIASDAQTELAAAQKDAERYRWLREHTVVYDGKFRCFEADKLQLISGNLLTGSQRLDAAVDSALAAGKGEG